MKMKGIAAKIAAAIRRSVIGTTDRPGIEITQMSMEAQNATMYRMIPILLVVGTLMLPSALGWMLVPPAMLNIKPIEMRSWIRRKCLVLTGLLALAVIQPTLMKSQFVKLG